MHIEIKLNSQTIWIGEKKLDPSPFRSYFTEVGPDMYPRVIDQGNNNHILILRHINGSVSVVNPDQTPVYASLNPPQFRLLDRKADMSAYDLDIDPDNEELWVEPIAKAPDLSDRFYRHFESTKEIKKEKKEAKRIYHSSSSTRGSDKMIWETGINIEMRPYERMIINSAGNTIEYAISSIRSIIYSPTANVLIVIAKGPKGKLLRFKHPLKTSEINLIPPEYSTITTETEEK